LSPGKKKTVSSQESSARGEMPKEPIIKTNLCYERGRKVQIDPSGINCKNVTQKDIDEFMAHNLLKFPKEFYLEEGLEWEKP